MIIEEIIKYNEQFVANKGYEKYLTSKTLEDWSSVLSIQPCAAFWLPSMSWAWRKSWSSPTPTVELVT